MTMKRHRVFKSKVYAVTANIKPINYGENWEVVKFLASGSWVQSNGGWYTDCEEYIPSEADRFRLENGKLPESQPRADGPAAALYVTENPFQRAYLL